MKCARDSDWCDGVICRDYGIECPNADPQVMFRLTGGAWEAVAIYPDGREEVIEQFDSFMAAWSRIGSLLPTEPE